ncbi:HNH endonuclease [Frankia sp. CiP3]|uniref:HNH endonuclease n=1 Tax=Frankia sp. CiP3 TaxID=2880971 RepID=UPI001EF4C3EC|nr:HNH endonuclease signature motif containing protein [Frankia sp. CiP3]
MINLSRPRFAAVDTYAACLTGIQDAERKARLVGDVAFVGDADGRYTRAGETDTLDGLAATDFDMPTATVSDMTWLYEKRLAGRTSQTRSIYDALKQAAPFGRCALCGVRDATTLDHCLPKSTFPSLAVNPLNLVPSCARCNQLKSSKRDATVHAYFDELSKDIWLSASIFEEKPCVIQFRIVCPSHWPQGFANRAQKHFEVLQLGELYSLQAGRTLRGDARALREVFKVDGPEGVRVYIGERAASWADYDQNCWEAAMYSAMSKSNWFCGGGFEID